MAVDKSLRRRLGRAGIECGIGGARVGEPCRLGGRQAQSLLQIRGALRAAQRQGGEPQYRIGCAPERLLDRRQPPQRLHVARRAKDRLQKPGLVHGADRLDGPGGGEQTQKLGANALAR